MDFQAHQAHAKQGTKQLIFQLILGTIAMVLILSALASAWFYIELGPAIGMRVFLLAAVATTTGILMSATIKNARVRNGGGMYLAASVGGWPIDFNTQDQAEKQLVNIVEEISVAAGVPAPAIFVLRDEPGINALAAGWDSNHAAIGVTRGALRHLTRTELQAVIAHEFSHIVNGDTQVKTRIIGWVYGISSIAVLGKSLLPKVRTEGKYLNSRPAVSSSLHGIIIFGIVGLALITLGSVGSWFAQLGQASITRKREHLADASAVEYTRDPDALAGALLKIGALGAENQLQAPHAMESAHLFFESPLRTAFATHPPLEKRVLALLPSWDGHWPAHKLVKESVNTSHDISVAGMGLPAIPGLPSNFAEPVQNIPGLEGSPVGPILGAALILDAVGSTPTPVASSERVMYAAPQLGPPTKAHIEHARHILSLIPEETKNFLHTRQGAVASVIGLLVSQDPALRPDELRRASELTGFDTQSLSNASHVISSLDRPLQLPCIDMALNSIRQTPADFQRALLQTTQDFSTSSPDTDLFRWMLRRVVMRHLANAEGKHQNPSNLHLEWLAPQAAVAYSVIAMFNSSGPAARNEAFIAAHRGAGLPKPSETAPDLQLRVDELDAALDKLAEMTHEGREAFIQGAIAAIDLDKQTSIDEAELIRVIADAVGLPIPPILPLAPSATTSATTSTAGSSTPSDGLAA